MPHPWRKFPTLTELFVAHRVPALCAPIVPKMWCVGWVGLGWVGLGWGGEWLTGTHGRWLGLTTATLVI